MIPSLKLLLPVLGIGLLLLAGAFLEWRRPKDARPLQVDQGFSRNDAHFADRFKALASPWWQEEGKALRLPPRLEGGRRHSEPCLAEDLDAGPGTFFGQELWIRGMGHLGEGSQARAILCEQALVLGRGCHVERWVHAEDCLTADEGCHLGARVTSGRVISLGPGCRANLISGAEIHWITRSHAFPVPLSPRIQRWESLEGGITSETPDGTVFVDGDVLVETNAHIDFPLVVRGHLFIRRDALLASDIKTHGDLVLEHAEVLGNLTALGRLVVGDGAVVQGCLRGDKGVWLGDRILLGRPHRLVAVVGKHIQLSGHGTLHGRMKALDGMVEVEA